MRRRIEGIEIFAEAQAVELIALLLECLGRGGADAAALVAQKAQQTDRRSSKLLRDIEVCSDVGGSKTYGQAGDEDDPGPDHLTRADVEVELRHPVVPGG